MAQLNFVWDSKQLGAWRGSRVEKAVARALSKAGGKAIRSMKVASSQNVRQRKRLSVKRVNSSLPLSFPKGAASNINSLVWTMRVSGKSMPVVDYPHRQVRKGVSVVINVGKRKVIESAFVATMRSGHTGVFRRAFSGAPRLPIEELFSSRVSDVFRDNGFIPAVQGRAQSVFASEFERLLPIEIARGTK